jgi:hypothetical protein
MRRGSGPFTRRKIVARTSRFAAAGAARRGRPTSLPAAWTPSAARSRAGSSIPQGRASASSCASACDVAHGDTVPVAPAKRSDGLAASVTCPADEILRGASVFGAHAGRCHVHNHAPAMLGFERRFGAAHARGNRSAIDLLPPAAPRRVFDHQVELRVVPVPWDTQKFQRESLLRPELGRKRIEALADVRV